MVRFIAFLALIIGSSHVSAAPAKINWRTNFEDAVSIAKAEKKPLLLFFTGSEWCGYCVQLDNEVFSSTTFADKVGDQFIFVVLDFPRKKVQDPKLIAQNRELQRKYDVKGFPTIILLDDQLQQIGVTGYRPGGPVSYAEHLLKMIENFKTYKRSVSALPQMDFKESELQALYLKACEHCLFDDAEKIVQVGTHLEHRFFLLERFKALASSGQIHEQESQWVRQKLLSIDPSNTLKNHYDVAIVEFETFSGEMEKECYAPEIAIAPLIAYIDRWGSSDHENLWRLHMLISQVFLDKNKVAEALKHAQASHLTAPICAQTDILTFIHNIQTR